MRHDPSRVKIGHAVDRRLPEPRPYHHGDLRASLLAAAARWLDEQGAETLTLRELARAAGVSHAAPYHHFAGRDELLAGVAEHAFDRLGDALAAAAAAPPTTRRRRCSTSARPTCARRSRTRRSSALMFGPMLARKAEHPGLQRAAERAFTVLLDASARLRARARPGARAGRLEPVARRRQPGHRRRVRRACRSPPARGAPARAAGRAAPSCERMVAALLQLPDPPPSRARSGKR